jgi:hypothetical protein
MEAGIVPKLSQGNPPKPPLGTSIRKTPEEGFHTLIEPFCLTI